MATVTYTNDHSNWVCESNQSLSVSSSEFQQFLSAIMNLRGGLAITQWKFNQVGSDYKLRMTPDYFGVDYQLINGVWQQKFKASNEYVNSDQIILVRPVNEALLGIVKDFDITKIQFDWM